MANTREWRIQPLVWYTLWEYKLYFVQTNKWYAKVFPRKWKPTKTPTFTFDWETKAQVIQKLDAHCLKTFGKVFRFKKMLQDKKEPKIKPNQTKVPEKIPCTFNSDYPDEVKKNAQEVIDGMLKLFANLIVDLDIIKRNSLICVVLSWLSLAWVIALIAFVL